MSELVKHLSNGRHPIIAEQYKDVMDLKQSIDREFVLIKFTDTKGGTELGFKLDQTLSDTNNASFEDKSGKVHLVGELTLDYERVRFVADIDLSTLQGEGHLEVLADAQDGADAVTHNSEQPSAEASKTIH